METVKSVTYCFQGQPCWDQIQNGGLSEAQMEKQVKNLEEFEALKAEAIQTFDLLQWASVETIRNMNSSALQQHLSGYLQEQFDADWMQLDASYRYDLTDDQRAKASMLDRDELLLNLRNNVEYEKVMSASTKYPNLVLARSAADEEQLAAAEAAYLSAFN